MQVREVMTRPVIRIHPDETVTVAARTLEHYNIGVLPVCGADGRLYGLVTDRDLVIRCLASGRSPATTTVREIMTGRVIWAPPEMDAGRAAQLMGGNQVRRLPVLENGKLCGMVSLADLARQRETGQEAGAALSQISSGIAREK